MAEPSLIDRYLALPGELQNTILSHCTANDVVCLSLVNKTLYSICAPPKPARLNTNELLKPPSPSEVLPSTHPCYRKPWPWDENEDRKRIGYYKNQCRPNECYHDEIFDCELWLRLREWMPKNTRYCRNCARFTKRLKSRRNGACKCTNPGRRTPDNNWTYQKYRGFHRNFWKLHYRESDLAKVVRRYSSPRTTTSHYGLRERTKPSRKLLEHTSQYQYSQNASGTWYRSDFS